MRRALLTACGLLGGLLAVAIFAGARSGVSASAASSSQAPTAGDGIKPELGLPATHVVAIGTSPNEEPGAVWMYGRLGPVPVTVAGHTYSNQYALLRHSDSSGWQVEPLPGDVLGDPAEYGAFAAQATAAGGVVLVSGQSVVIRDPGGEPELAPAPPPIETTTPKTQTPAGHIAVGGVSRPKQSATVRVGEEPGEDEAAGGKGTTSSAAGEPPSEPEQSGVLGEHESLLPTSSSSEVTLPYAAIEEPAGSGAPQTGVLIAPYRDGSTAGVAAGVLHYNGDVWDREKIDTEGEDLEDFTALALSCGGTTANTDASSPQNCWLLASAQAGKGRAHEAMLLYQRVASGSSHEWKRVKVAGRLDEQGASFPLSQGAQMLTATAQGVWVDFLSNVGASSGHESAVSELVETAGSEVKALGPWCYPTGTSCERSLGSSLPKVYRSYAWPGGAGEPGTRIITGLKDRAMLELSGGSFRYEVGAGGSVGEAPGGAAFYPPQGNAPLEGWVADASRPDAAADGAGQAQAVKLTANPEGSQLGAEAVPFRRPLLAVAQPPGTTPGATSVEAVAVGELGQVGRYAPGVGWRSESLYDSEGVVQTPTLRGVAWPEPGRIYAVGDNGAMWLWRAETGLWEPDPDKLPNFIGNLQAIAFAPGDPQLGYAVGRQGTILKFGKSWEQVPLPPELQQVNFTSITFANGEALATYRTLALPTGASSQLERIETGGVAVEEVGDGMHWHIDPGASALLGQLPESNRVLSKIAGLADGGVVAAGPGKVIERESSSSAWRFSTQPLPEAANISALGAFREAGGTLRAIVSVDLDEQLDPERFTGDLEETPFKIDVPPPSEPGRPPVFLGPDLLPNSGYLLRETADGWSDMEHQALPAPNGRFPVDMPARPDPALALLVDPEGGSSGIAVGGQTGDLEGRGLGPPNNVHLQTAAAERFPASAASADGATQASIATKQGAASFLIGGQAACAQLCSDFSNEHLGPDMWLEHALKTAGEIASGGGGGLRAFIYTGGRLPLGAAQEAITKNQGEGTEALERELARFAQLLGSGGSLPPVYATPSEDLTGTSAGSGVFSTELLSPLGDAAEGHDYYVEHTNASGGPEVTVIVLSFLDGELETGELTWLEEELRSASEHGVAVVVGSESLGFSLPHQNASSAEQSVVVAKDGALISQVLVNDGASAYFFDYPGANVNASVTSGTCSIPAYGSGTLGYVTPEDESYESDSLGSSGLLLTEVTNGQSRSGESCPHANKITNVTVRQVPNIASLAIDATDGVYLRRSQVALFEALARRAPGGLAIREGEGLELAGPDPYDKIPFDCLGPNCAYEVPEEYTFTSSNPDVGGFVEHESSSANPRQVLLGANQLPVSDEPRDAKGELTSNGRFEERNGEPINESGEVVARDPSGLFCAFNAGTTVVSVSAGGFTYSAPVTVQAGSVEYPCGTVPLKNPPVQQVPAKIDVPSPQLSSPAGPTPQAPPVLVTPPTPVPVAAPVVPAVPTPSHPSPIFPAPLIPPTPVPPAIIVPPPLAPAGEPTPPSGTSPVFQPMQATREEKEDEEAVESVDNAAMSYDPHEGSGPGPWLVLLAVIAAGAGVGIRRGGRRDTRSRPAFANTSARRRPPRW